MDDEIEADYLVVGAGAAGMGFADALLEHCDATITIVDPAASNRRSLRSRRRSEPGTPTTFAVRWNADSAANVAAASRRWSRPLFIAH
jgi:hypothetical protein